MKDYRCPHCNRLLLKANIESGELEIKCACKQLVRLEFKPVMQARTSLQFDWNGIGMELAQTVVNPTPQPVGLHARLHRAAQGEPQRVDSPASWMKDAL